MQASSCALFSSLTETSSGRCRSIWPASSSRLPPAASATIPNRSGSASTTERHWRPMEPVEPRMDSCFKKLSAPFDAEPDGTDTLVGLWPHEWKDLGTYRLGV